MARKLRCPGDKRGLSRETKGYLRISPCSGLGLEQREVRWSQFCWAVGGMGVGNIWWLTRCLKVIVSLWVGPRSVWEACNLHSVRPCKRKFGSPGHLSRI